MSWLEYWERLENGDVLFREQSDEHVALQVGLSVRRFGHGPWLCCGWGDIHSIAPSGVRSGWLIRTSD
jgi:hypothetical protein